MENNARKSLMSELERYRRNAEMSLEQADLARTEHDREAWLKLADEWTKMADAKERRYVKATSPSASPPI